MVAKVITACMALLYATGFVWFPSDNISITDVVVFTVVVCSLIVSFFPEKRIKNTGTVSVLIGLVLIAIIGLISIVFIDFMRKYSFDYVGFMLDTIFIVSLFYVGLNFYKKLPFNT